WPLFGRNAPEEREIVAFGLRRDAVQLRRKAVVDRRDPVVQRKWPPLVIGDGDQRILLPPSVRFWQILHIQPAMQRRYGTSGNVLENGKCMRSTWKWMTSNSCARRR